MLQQDIGELGCNGVSFSNAGACMNYLGSRRPAVGLGDVVPAAIAASGLGVGITPGDRAKKSPHDGGLIRIC